MSLLPAPTNHHLPAVIILSLLLSFSATLKAKDFSRLYRSDQLLYVQSHYGKNIKIVLFDNVRRYLLPNERKTLSEITLNIPLIGENKDIFDFYMNLQTGEMTIPALSVKFFDDMSIAFAWYEAKHKDKTEIIQYVFRLYQQEDYLQPPLKALGIPEKAWELDNFVDDVSQKTLKSGMAFLLLHEMGHWHYRHAPYDSISNRQAQEQEKQSDALALDVMGRMHTIPYGMVTWFILTGLLQSAHPTTHPLTADRLYAIADKIANNPAVFISLENANNASINEILSVAKNIRIIANQMTIVRNKQ